MYKICFYVPVTHTEQVKTAMFEKGAGKISNYSCCAWQVLGEGQFKPLDGSNPFIGEQNRLEKVSEYKVEMLCDEKLIKNVIAALRSAHPYEEPAIDIIKCEDF
jgi:hypothetical protein